MSPSDARFRRAGRGAPGDRFPEGGARHYGTLARWLDARQASLRYVFTTADIIALGLSRSALYEALRRRRRTYRVVRIGAQRGLWAIVPLEYRSVGAPPTRWLIDDIMLALGMPYYVGLRSAAEWYGATHYAVQATQVLVPRQMRSLSIGRERVRFIVNRDLAATPTRIPPGQATPLRVSTAEATALDLVRYTRQSGGITRVVTALAQIRAACTPHAMRTTLEQVHDVPAAQRLGYCWELVGARALAASVATWLQPQALRSVALDASTPRTAPVVHPWRVAVDVPPEVDL